MKDLAFHESFNQDIKNPQGKIWLKSGYCTKGCGFPMYEQGDFWGVEEDKSTQFLY